MARLFSVIWYLLAILLVVWAALYVTIHAVREPAAAVGYLIMFAFLVIVLFFGEGTDTAVSRLYDKDPDQLPASLREGFAALHTSDPVVFISGRQLLVVGAVVGMTLLGNNLSDVERLDARGLAGLARVLGLDAFRGPFEVLFPTFFALWFAQLPPKFIAHESPLRAYGWRTTRATIGFSMLLGRTFHVQGPSKRIMAWMMRLLGIAASLEPEHLRPSRERYYKTSATLRDGRSMERVRIVMEIGRDGAVRVSQELRFRAFARGFRRISQRIAWESPVHDDAALVVHYCPVEWAERGPFFLAPAVNVAQMHMYPVEWELELASDLPVGEHLDVEFAYSTDPGAAKSKPDEADYFHYSISRVPTAELIFEVRTAPDAEFILVNGEAKADTSDEERINLAEASRVSVDGVERGYVFRVMYPLLSTDLSFEWTIGRRGNPHAKEVVAGAAR